MLEKVKDVKLARKGGAYQSALALALTLPDICSQVEYPSEKRVWLRYEEWCDNYIDFSDARVGLGTEQAELNGKVFYLLRCAFLHCGNDDILNQTAAQNVNITSFELLKPGGLNGYGYAYSVNGQSVITKVDMDYVCDLICDAVERYYNNHVNKSDFNDYACMIKRL